MTSLNRIPCLSRLFFVGVCCSYRTQSERSQTQPKTFYPISQHPLSIMSPFIGATLSIPLFHLNGGKLIGNIFYDYIEL